MTRVIFYINVADSARFLRRFLHNKVFKSRQTALIYGGETVLEKVDSDLWAESFLPHQRLDPEDESDTAPILLTSETPPPQHRCDILISLAEEVPTAFAGRFPAFVDIIGTGDKDKQAGRERYRYFQEHGYPLEVVDMKGK